MNEIRSSMVTAVPLEWVLIVAAALFCIGLFGSLSRRNTVGILMGVELMLNAVNINLVAFWRYLEPGRTSGLIFAIFAIAVAAAEVAVGLAMVIAVYRTRLTINADEIDTLKG
jgi:NADH-quinone oxidoreductase subunit K